MATKYDVTSIDKSNASRNTQLFVHLIKGDDNSLEKWINSSEFLDFFKDITNGDVSEQIYSYRAYPFDLFTFFNSLAPMGTTHELACGTTSKSFPSSTFYRVGETDTNATRLIGSVQVTPYFNDFRDYAPYTRMWLYIPFLGVRELDVNRLDIHNGQSQTLKIYCTLNLVEGRALFRVTDSDGDNIYIQEETEISMDVPIVRSDIQDRLKNLVTLGANIGVSAMSGGSLAPIVISNAITNMKSLQPHYELGNLSSGMLKMYMPNYIHLITQRPKNIYTPEQMSEFVLENGIPCENYYSFDELNSLEQPYCKFNVQRKDFNGIAKAYNITRDELDEFIALLNNGVYIPYYDQPEE